MFLEFLSQILIFMFGILSLLVIIGIVFFSWIASNKTAKRYKLNIIAMLKQPNLSVDNNLIDKISSAYDSYRNKRYGFGYLGIVQLNQELIEELRIGQYRKYCKDTINVQKITDMLDKIVILLKEQKRFDDEKANQLFDRLQRICSNDDKFLYSDLQKYFLSMTSFKEGQLFERQYTIDHLEEKLKRKHWTAWILGGIGLLGSISSIITYFR